MPIGSTSTIFNDQRDSRKIMKALVRDKEAENIARSKRGISGILKRQKIGTMICSQCKRSMRKDWGEIQIANKRENAPICMACIMGYKRKPLIKVLIEARKERACWKQSTRDTLDKIFKKSKTNGNKK